MAERLTKRFLATLTPRDATYYVNDSGVKGFQARVNVDGSITFCVLYRLPDGRRRRYTIGPASVFSPEQARDMAIEFIGQARKGEDPQEAKKRNRAHTFRTFIDEVYRPWLASNKKTGEYMADTLLATFKDFHDLKLDAVTPWLVEKWRKDMRGKGRKPGTINRNITYLKAMLNRAATWGFIETPKLHAVKKDREDSTRVRYLSDEERQRLMDALDAREERIRAERDSYNAWARQRGYAERVNLHTVAYADYLKPMVLLSLNLGLRRGELFGLDWMDVSFDHRTVKIRPETTKTNKARFVPMNAAAFDVLTAWREQTGSAGLVFKSPQTGGRFDNVKKAWMELLRDAGIEGFRWHDMRHDFASKLVMSGADLYVVKELLGHASVTMTERYAHLSPSATAAAVKLLDAPANVVPLPAAAEGKT